MNTIARFLTFIDKQDSGCWIWMGGKNASGYGLFSIGRKLRLAHRMSWEFTYGFSPDNLVICHRCDNRACVNPEHLFLGDNKDNAKDKMKKGRHIQSYGNTKLTISDILEIRELWLTGNYSQIELAKKFNVGHSCINRVIDRNKWRGIDLEPIKDDVRIQIRAKRKLMNLRGR